MTPPAKHVVIIGAGFTGLAAGYEFAKAGVRVTLIDPDTQVGGLAGSFTVNGVPIEKFYHHWFTNDRHVIDLVQELNLQANVLHRPTRTGMYYAKTIFRLSNPLDVLKFTPLSFIDRLRLGWLAVRARMIKDWRDLESLTAAEWLQSLGGKNVYRVVWQPLLHGKFGPYANDISAVWFWSKLKLRGGSRGDSGKEVLAYYQGGFAALAGRIATEIKNHGGEIRLGVAATGVRVDDDNRVVGVETSDGQILSADAVLATPALPIIAKLVERHAPPAYVEQLRKIDYLGNVCLVLVLDRSLSDTYWLNVNAEDFPYVGIIEHTNFEPPETYGGKHLVYLSKYLPIDSELYQMQDEEVLEFSIPHIQRMFPEFRREWISDYHVWRAQYAQPIVVKHYSRLMPALESPLPGLCVATMAQIYPEDRGTNYAIGLGREAARQMLQSCVPMTNSTIDKL